MKKYFALICCIAMALSLASCNGGKSISEQAAEDMSGYLTNGAVSDSDAVMTVNGESVPASYYMYWIANAITQVEAVDENFDIDSEEEFGGYDSVREYILENAQDYAVYYWTFDQHVRTMDVSLTEAQENTLQQYLDGLTENTLLYNCTNLADQSFIYCKSLYTETMEDTLFADGGLYEVTEDQIQDYIGDQEYLTVSYMYFPNQDVEREEGVIVNATEIAEEAYETLQNAQADEIESTFLEYAYLSGVYNLNRTILSTDGNIDPEVSSIVLDMNTNECKLVASESGTYVIYRSELNTDYIKESYVETAFSKLTYEWQNKAEVEVTDAYQKLDLSTIYENMTALRSEIYSAETQTEYDSDGISVNGGDTTTNVKIISN